MSACRRISQTNSPAPGLTENRGRNQLRGNSESGSGSRMQGPPVALPLPAGPKVVLTSDGGADPPGGVSRMGGGGKSGQGWHGVAPAPPPPSGLPPVARLPPVALPPSTPPLPVLCGAAGLN